MGSILKVGKQDFRTEVLSADIPVLVDFFATWCSPCSRLTPVLEAIDEEMKNKLKIVKVNVEEERELAQEYGVMSLPTLLLFKNGKLVNKMMGYMPKDRLLAKLEPLL